MPALNLYSSVLNKVRRAHLTVKGAFARSFKWLRQNPRWLYAALLIAAGIWVGDLLEEKQAFLDLRYRAYQITQDAAGSLKGELYDHNTILVLIGDDEYWKGPYEGRRPINRESLGQLVAALDKYDPKVIALDFDFSSPAPDGSIVEFPKYVEETKKLADTIKDVSSRRSVVLPRTLGFDGLWIEESDVYDKYDLGQARFGYIALYNDYRLVPKSVPLKSGDRLDSFAEAIVRCFDLTGNGVKCDRHDETLTYAGAYLYEEQFTKYFANQIMSPDSATQRDLVEKLPGKIVIIGGAWSRYAFNRGSRIDERYTPVGFMPAVYLHANWVESMLESRTARPLWYLPRWTLEFLLGFVAYYLFTSKLWWVWKLLYVPLLALSWLGVAYISAQNFGVFFDPFIVTLVSFAKAAYEQISEWYKDARRYNKLVAKKSQPVQEAVHAE